MLPDIVSKMNRIGCIARFVSLAASKGKAIEKAADTRIADIQSKSIKQSQGMPAESAGIRFAAYQKAQKEKE